MANVDMGGGITQAEYERQLRSAQARAEALRAAERTPPPQPAQYADFSSIPNDFRPPAAPAAPTAPPVIPPGSGAGAGFPGGSAVPGATPPGTAPSGNPPLDWHSYLTQFAIDDPAVQKKLEEIFRSTTDAAQAIAIGLAYVRGTDWYARTYPGIFEAQAKGLVSDERDYRSQLNQIDQLYRQYYGRGVSTTEYTDYLKAGKNAARIANELQGGAITDALSKANPSLASYFNTGEIAKIGATRAGLSNAEGIYLSGLYDFATQVNPLYQQYGQALDRGSLETLFKSGTTATVAGQRLAGQAFVGANRGELQALSGAFGEGQLNADELTALGNQRAGLDTQLGNQVANRIAQAQRRVQGVFNGVLASPAFTAQGGRLRSSQRAAPDLGA